MVKFLRRTWHKYSKLGRGRKKIQTWRRPTGRDNKMREKRRGYPSVVSIGYRKDKILREKIENKKPIIIYNLNDLKKIKKDQIAVIGKIGKKKKIEILKKAQEIKIDIYKTNIEKFLKKSENSKIIKNKEDKIDSKKIDKENKKWI